MKKLNLSMNLTSSEVTVNSRFLKLLFEFGKSSSRMRSDSDWLHEPTIFISGVSLYPLLTEL